MRILMLQIPLENAQEKSGNAVARISYFGFSEKCGTRRRIGDARETAEEMFNSRPQMITLKRNNLLSLCLIMFSHGSSP